ncbi:MAG TPA: NAD-dependent epimerase/dehydratase family protein [Tepidisphaeraceae bacterium]|jgi:UDP-glucose 4-epimerase|nr:NAD-dependent epimerase/dehydratase family protein [Tepidisphaeraceae bacterium]
MAKYFIVGGAGFIGSHLVRHLLADEPDAAVAIYDNFSSGREWHLGENLSSPRVTIVRGDVKDLPALTAAMAGHEHVYHFASNPDIAKAVKQPDIDFWEGTYLTQNVLEAMRQSGVKKLTYASGSGVYGDTGSTPVYEDYAPLLPISTYGASKLAGEALINAYCYMFDMAALAFRFANVVGPHQTHGVSYDFIRRLMEDPTQLAILGDGQQSKSYVHVDDVVSALRFVAARGMSGFGYYNVATEDYVTVREIADLVCARLGITGTTYHFGGGARGWKGDVPLVRFDSSKLRALGWRNGRTAVQALQDSIDSMIADAKEGNLYRAS